MRSHLREKVELSEGITVIHKNNLLVVQGPNGSIERNAILPGITIKQEGDSVVIEAVNGTKREKTLINTYKAHLKNLMRGLTEGHVYKLKICSSHFPMNVSVKGQDFEVKNFIGEKVPRKITFPKSVSVKVEGDNITVEGINKEKVGGVAGKIELLCRRSCFDKRIFQDGIYIIEKDGKVL